MSQIICLVGPTAVGKSAIAIEVARALDAEIVSCDSMQVYARMPILTQAPTKAQRTQVPHHLIECVDPTDAFNVGTYAKLAGPLIHHLTAQGKRVLIVGGTGLYLRAITHGLCEAPPADRLLRDRLWHECEGEGSVQLHNRLQHLDAAAASRIHPHDARRIIRALEVFALTGKPISEWWRTTRAAWPNKELLLIGVTRDRRDLYARINQRLLQMIYEDGVINEVRHLLRVPLSQSARQVHGLADLERYLGGQATLSETIATWQQRVRNYARRQLIWFRRIPNLQWIDVSAEERPWQTAERIVDLIHHRPETVAVS